MQLILSLFPGIDILGRGFEAEGYAVVRGPDLIYGGDIRNFNVPPGRFDGVIGGPPCQDFSRARRGPATGNGLEMLEEFRRVVGQAAPRWWLAENVPSVPDIVIGGYSHQRIDVNASEFGLRQNRPRHFQFGHRDGLVLSVDRRDTAGAVEGCCMASEGSRKGRRGWAEFCALQGLPDGIDLPGMSVSARYRAVGNAVPLPVARAMAAAIRDAVAGVEVCGCGCGRLIAGRQQFAGAACRKRMQRKRDASIADKASWVTL